MATLPRAPRADQEAWDVADRRRGGRRLRPDRIAVRLRGRGSSRRPTCSAWPRGLTGGYLPLSATLTTEEVYSRRSTARPSEGKTFFHGHTFAGNPLGAAVALASLRVFDDEKTLERTSRSQGRIAPRARLAELWPPGRTSATSVRKGLIAGDRAGRGQGQQDAIRLGEPPGRRPDLPAMPGNRWACLIRPLGDVLVDDASACRSRSRS